MIDPPFPAAWLTAAHFERDRRQASYPRVIEQRPEREDELTADFQCWCCIAIWLEKGRCDLIGAYATPAVVHLTWARLEQAAASALASIASKVERDATDDRVPAEALAATRQRWQAIFAIHNALTHQVALVESTARMMAQRRRAALESAA